MYFEGGEHYLYHIRHYGHPSKFGYKDLVKTWKAERFDPEGLMDLYVAAGAKYFVSQAMHHDHFFNYGSKIHRWNSVQMGPEKDIVGLWKAAADRRGLPFGLTEHLGATFSWWRVNKGADAFGPYAGVPYDGNDPDYADLYLDNREHPNAGRKFMDLDPWYTKNKAWQARWLSIVKELVDLYHPDLLYSDGPLPFGEGQYEAGLEAVAYLYNASAARHGGANRAVYTQKDRSEAVYSVGVLDIERSQEPGVKKDAWQTDTCVGAWFYDVRTTYKKPAHVVEILVDIVSKNGNLLLNIPQKPDGTIDEECAYIVKELAAWRVVCGEGVFGTRPFRVFGEGPASVAIDGFKEEQTSWTASDFRFTQKGNTLFAFQMRWPENGLAVIQSLTPADKVKSVRLLGAGELPFQQAYGALVVRLPSERPTPYANCLAIELG
jgi:alpha-L-fucosidase